jgi:hypothetical protein
MLKETNNSALNKILRLGVLILFVTGFSNAFVAAQSREKLDSKVEEAMTLYRNGQTEQAQEVFREIGDPASPHVAELFSQRLAHSGVIDMPLFNIIAATKGDKSDAALIGFLSHENSYVRGLTASFLGKRRTEAAIPYLISLLADKGVYLNGRLRSGRFMVDEKGNVDVGGSWKPPTLVMDEVIKALELITGLKLEDIMSKEEQAEAWKRWSKKRH